MIKLTPKQKLLEKVMFRWGEEVARQAKFRVWLLFTSYYIAMEFTPNEWMIIPIMLLWVFWWWMEITEPARIRKAMHLTPLPKKEKDPASKA